MIEHYEASMLKVVLGGGINEHTLNTVTLGLKLP